MHARFWCCNLMEDKDCKTICYRICVLPLMGFNHSSEDLSLPGCATVLACADPVVPDTAMEHRAFIFRVKQCKNRLNVPENEGLVVLLNARNQPNNTA